MTLRRLASLFAIYIAVSLSLVALATAQERPIIRVTTVMEPPFVMAVEDENATIDARPNEDNVRFKDGKPYIGYIVDLLDDLAERMEVSFLVQFSADRSYGRRLDRHSIAFNGMIGEVINGIADVAAAALTVTADRSQFIDFAQPFMTRKFSLLVKRPEDGSSLTLNDIVSDDPPKSDYEFLTMPNGSTWGFFNRQTTGRNGLIGKKLKDNHDKIVDLKSAFNAIEEVRLSSPSDRLAFVGELPMLSYFKQHDCSLITVGEFGAERAYALAVRKGLPNPRNDSKPFLVELNHELLALRESGRLEELENRWWTHGAMASDMGMCKLSSPTKTQPPNWIFFLFIFAIIAVSTTLAWYFATRVKQQRLELNSVTTLGQKSTVEQPLQINNQRTNF